MLPLPLLVYLFSELSVSRSMSAQETGLKFCHDLASEGSLIQEISVSDRAS